MWSDRLGVFVARRAAYHLPYSRRCAVTEVVGQLCMLACDSLLRLKGPDWASQWSVDMSQRSWLEAAGCACRVHSSSNETPMLQ